MINKRKSSDNSAIRPMRPCEWERGWEYFHTMCRPLKGLQQGLVKIHRTGGEESSEIVYPVQSNTRVTLDEILDRTESRIDMLIQMAIIGGGRNKRPTASESKQSRLPMSLG